MTDHTPFRRTIARNPADMGPRLVFADWLEERGDPRGEYIRLAIELAKGRQCGNSNPEGCRTRCAYCPKFDALRDRCAALLAEHGERWIKEMLGELDAE